MKRFSSSEMATWCYVIVVNKTQTRDLSCLEVVRKGVSRCSFLIIASKRNEKVILREQWYRFSIDKLTYQEIALSKRPNKNLSWENCQRDKSVARYEAFQNHYMPTYIKEKIFTKQYLAFTIIVSIQKYKLISRI